MCVFKMTITRYWWYFFGWSRSNFKVFVTIYFL